MHSSRSYNELRLWFPSIKSLNDLRAIRSSSSRCLPSAVLLEAGQYYVAANHLSLIGENQSKRIIELAEPLIKTSLAEILMASSYSDEDVLALQVVSFFQVCGSLSLPLLSASTRIAHLVMLSAPKSINKRLAWCSASVWEACIALGIEQGIQLFRPEQCPTLDFIDDLSAYVDQDDVAARAILIRGRGLAHLSNVWQKLNNMQSIACALQEWDIAFKNTQLSIKSLRE